MIYSSNFVLSASTHSQCTVRETILTLKQMTTRKLGSQLGHGAHSAATLNVELGVIGASFCEVYYAALTARSTK